mmetsp:Transcript_1846/g.2116  ORF Transcript_1846/g.2116 Transcript_1846/m.2116 type:complete len:237 (+) Transcript_1846:151-861(+)
MADTEGTALAAQLSTSQFSSQNLEDNLFMGVFGSKLNLKFGFVNSLLSTSLLAVSIYGMIIIFSDEESEISCTIGSEDKLCGFKYTCFVLSIFLLLPYLYEAVNSADLFIGGRIDEVKADSILDQVMKSSVTQNMGRAWKKLVYLIIAIVLSFPLIVAIPFSSTAADTWKAFPFVVPSLVFNLALFPLSFLIIFSSQTVGETFVNLVAVQIFASLADTFIVMVFRPERQLASTLSL